MSAAPAGVLGIGPTSWQRHSYVPCRQFVVLFCVCVCLCCVIDRRMVGGWFVREGGAHAIQCTHTCSVHAFSQCYGVSAAPGLMQFDANWLAARGEGPSSTYRPHPGGPAPGLRVDYSLPGGIRILSRIFAGKLNSRFTSKTEIEDLPAHGAHSRPASSRVGVAERGHGAQVSPVSTHCASQPGTELPPPACSRRRAAEVMEFDMGVRSSPPARSMMVSMTSTEWNTTEAPAPPAPAPPDDSSSDLAPLSEADALPLELRGLADNYEGPASLIDALLCHGMPGCGVTDIRRVAQASTTHRAQMDDPEVWRLLCSAVAIEAGLYAVSRPRTASRQTRIRSA